MTFPWKRTLGDRDVPVEVFIGNSCQMMKLKSETIQVYFEEDSKFFGTAMKYDRYINC